MAIKQKTNSREIHGAAPGLHNVTEHGTLARQRKRIGIGLAALTFASGPFILRNMDSSSHSKSSGSTTAESVTKLSPVERALKNGAVEHTNEALILRPGVRLRNTPVVTEIVNGKDGDTEVPIIHNPTVILKPVYVEGPYGDTFILYPNGDGEPSYISTKVLGMPNEYADNLPYGTTEEINPDSYTDTRPSTVETIKGGEPGLAGYLTTLKK